MPRAWEADQVAAKLSAAFEDAIGRDLVVRMRFIAVEKSSSELLVVQYGRIEITRANVPFLWTSEPLTQNVHLLVESCNASELRRRLEDSMRGEPFVCDGRPLESEWARQQPQHDRVESNKRAEWGVEWPCDVLRYSARGSVHRVQGLLEGKTLGVVQGLVGAIEKVSGFAIYHREADARNHEVQLFILDFRGRILEAELADEQLRVGIEAPSGELRVRAIAKIGRVEHAIASTLAESRMTFPVDPTARSADIELTSADQVVDSCHVERATSDVALSIVQKQVSEGQTPQASVREVLSWFGAERRGSKVVSAIRQQLEHRGLKTVPDFTDAWIDGSVQFTRLNSPESESDTDDDSRAESTTADAQRPDPVVRLQLLGAANKDAPAANPNTSVAAAATKMLIEGVSQLPILSGKTVKGVLTWEAIVKALLQDHDVTVQGCMSQVTTFDVKTPVLEALPDIARQGFIVVRNGAKVCVVTAADVAVHFRQSTEAFLLIAQIEQRLRALIEPAFSVHELKALKQTEEDAALVASVDDLSFGDYVRLLQRPDAWLRLKTRIDRETTIERLTLVNAIRNEVMHFERDPVTDQKMIALRLTAAFFEQLVHAPLSTTAAT